MKQSLKEAEADYQFQKKGKKFKTKYFSALKQLFGEANNDTDCQTEQHREGEIRPTQE
jgi:hypothetical protein